MKAIASISTKVPVEQKELIDLMTKKAKITPQMIVENALSRWIGLNIDLLTDKEKKRFEDFLISK